MTLSRNRVVTLGVLTVLPALCLVVLLGAFVALFVSPERLPEGGPGVLNWAFVVGVILPAGAAVLTVGLLIFYIVHLFGTTLVPQDAKALWAVVLFLGSVIAMPVYWYLYLWRPLRAPQAMRPVRFRADA